MKTLTHINTETNCREVWSTDEDGEEYIALLHSFPLNQMKLLGVGMTSLPGGTGLAEDSHYWASSTKPVIDPAKPFQVRRAYPGGLGWSFVRDFATLDDAKAYCDNCVKNARVLSSWTVLEAVEVQS